MGRMNWLLRMVNKNQENKQREDIKKRRKNKEQKK
jgi:hypothetical protein